MHSIIRGEYFLMDRTLKSVSFCNTEVSLSETCIYEVIRIENSKLLFWNDHEERLNNSLRIANVLADINTSKLLPKIKMMIAANGIKDGNVKLDFRFFSNGEKLFMAYFVNSHYPSETEQASGIKCSFQFSERTNPTAKIYNPSVRGKANTIIEQRDVYETILVNHDNCMTEGSRSNLFFIKDGELITADDSLVLPGVIRKQVISIAKQLGITILYRSLAVDQLNDIEAAFITGTSPRILAIKQLDKHIFELNNPVYLKLLSELQKLIASQIA